MFKMVFKFIIILTKKSCYKSALEYCKLLLKLNPVRDPLGALIMMDHLCLASGQYHYFEEFALTFSHRYFHQADSSILFYPNVLFSFALSRFKVSNDKKIIDERSFSELKPDDLKSISSLNINPRLVSADCLLLLGLILYPQLFKQILMVNEQNKQNPTHSSFSEFQKRNWKDLLEHSAIFLEFPIKKIQYQFLNMDCPADEEAIEKIHGIYPVRNKLLWKHSNVNVWMKRVCGFLVEAVEKESWEIEHFRASLNLPKDIDLENNMQRFRLPFEPKIHRALLMNKFSDEEAQIDFGDIDAQDREQLRNMPQDVSSFSYLNHFTQI